MIIMPEKILESLIEVAPLLKDLLQEDISVSITDKTTFLAHYNSDRVKLNIKVGDKIPSSGPLQKVMDENIIMK